MHLVLHRKIPADPALRQQWNDLVFSIENPQVFYTYEWALAVARAYRNSLTPLIWLGYEEGQLIGLAALAESAQRPHQAFFLGGATADYCDFICAPVNAAVFCKAVFNDLRHRGFSGITLPNTPKDSSVMAAICTAADDAGYRVYSRTAYHCAQVVLGTGSDREQIRAGVAKRHVVKRQIASMSKIATVTVTHDRTNSQVGGCLPGFFRMHVARFMAMGRTSNLLSRERRAFLSELTALLSERQWLVNSRLMVGNEAVASNFGFCFAGTWFWYQPAFQQRMLKNSPGLCLLSKIVNDACDTPDIGVVDLGLGAEEYKERFANSSRETRHITLHTSAVSHLTEIVRYRSGMIASKSPAVESFLRLQRERLAKVKKRGLIATGKRLLDAARRHAFSRDEVFFYRWKSVNPPEDESFQLKPIEMEDVADAAMRYCDDAETQAYLLRAVQRIQGTQAKGYVLLTPGRVPVHFCWTNEFDRFHMDELDHTLDAEGPDWRLIFDCWTPGKERGKKYYQRAISMLAAQAAATGSIPWIFSAKENKPSQQGIVCAGFEPQFSLLRKRSFFRTRLSRSPSETASSELQPAVFAA